MSGDLLALAVALTLGTMVVILGLRRNLSETTRRGLPRSGGASATLGLYQGEERRRRQLSRRQRRWLALFYLVIALIDAAVAVFAADDRALHAGTAGLFALAAAFLAWQGFSHRSAGSAP